MVMFTGIACISKKARSIGLIICIGTLLVASLARAADNSTEVPPVIKFTGGIVAAFMIHEGAHALIAGVTGTSMDWEIGNVNQPISFTEHSKNDDRGLAVNSAGLLAQAGCSEFILYADKIDKNDSFIRGMMLWNILNPIFYAVDYWFIEKTNKINGNSFQGDLSGVEFHSNKGTADIFAGTLVALAAFQAYRYAKTQSWAPEWLKNMEELEHLSFTPLPSGGALLAYTFRF